VAVLAVSLVGATGASASTEVGNVCTATAETGPITILQLANASSALPLETPAAGVVTSWRVDTAVSTEPEVVLKALVAGGAVNQLKVVAESEPQKMVKGLNVFPARIPVPAGTRFGIYGFPVVTYCTGKPGDVLGDFPGNLLTTDAAETILQAPELKSPVSAVVEPDADSDGFGDETQDKCPQLASVHDTECPSIGLSTFAIARRASAVVLVSADTRTPVTVFATVTVPKQRKGRRRSKRARASAVVKLSDVTKTVEPGQIVPFALKFTHSLRARLKSMTGRQSLTLEITARATNAAGQASTDASSLKLKGQKASRRKG
jgi:hypothetical protein